VSILPYLAQEKLYSEFDRTKAWDAPENARLIQGSTWPLERCPACPPWAALPAGFSTYVGMAGVGTDAASLPVGNPRAGVFGYERRVRYADITDGTSNTIMIAETLAENGPWSAGGPATVRGIDTRQRPYLGPGRQFGGLHRGITQVVTMDGSVKPFSNEMSPEVFEAFATMAGGEVILQDF
jgi:hypothetical protein